MQSGSPFHRIVCIVFTIDLETGGQMTKPLTGRESNRVAEHLPPNL